MSVDPNDRSHLPEPESKPAAGPEPVAPSEPGAPPGSPAAEGAAEAAPRRRILIGSQRDPAAYRPRPKRDWIPSHKRRPDRRSEQTDKEGTGREEPLSQAEAEEQTPSPAETAPQQATPAETPSQPVAVVSPATPEPLPMPPPPVAYQPAAQELPIAEELLPDELPETPELPTELGRKVVPVEPGSARRFPPPSRRDRLSADLEAEFQEALGDVPLEDLMAGDDAAAPQAVLERESRRTGRVVAVQRDNVFIELGGREQGFLPLAQFETAPEAGATLDVVVARFNAEDGLYELTLPHASASVEDWSDLSEGLVVDAHVTGHNTGGLECEVHHIRGFIPVSQIALYRVENLEEFVGQKFPCVVTEANPQRRNLVLSRRAVLEREREEARHTLLESLAPGQIREGVVRKLTDFGAFVDLGSGVDGLLHISQMSWARISHPREVFQQGQTIQVRIEKVDTASGRISLTYREMLENPWTNVEQKYPPRTPVRGKVTRLMEFGAFVELEPGVEGLVHISELSRKHVRRVGDVVKEGQEVEVMVLAVDPQAKRISLSMKDLLPPEPEPAKAKQGAPPEPEPPAKIPKKPSQPLQGGLGRAAGGSRFGLKW